MTMWLKLECTAGTSIESAAADGQRIADKLGVSVEFEFNGVKCWAVPGGDAAKLANRQQEEQRTKQHDPEQRKYANSRL